MEAGTRTSIRRRIGVISAWALLAALLGVALLFGHEDAAAPAAMTDRADESAAERAEPEPSPSRDGTSDAQRRAPTRAPAEDPAPRLRGRVLCASTRAPVLARIGTERAAIFSSAEDGSFDSVLDVGSGTSVSVSAPAFEPQRVDIGGEAPLEVWLRPIRAGRVLVRRVDHAPVAGAEIWTTAEGARVSLGSTDSRGELAIPTGRALLVWAESGGSLSPMEHLNPGDATELVLTDGGGRIGLRGEGGSPAVGVRFRVQRVDAWLVRTDNGEELVTGTDGMSPPLPYGTYAVSSASHSLWITREPSHDVDSPARRARNVDLSVEVPTAWLRAVVLPSLTVRVVDEDLAPWTGTVTTWLEGPSDGDRDSSAHDFEPDETGLVEWPFLHADDVSSDTRLSVTADGKAVTRVLVELARQHPPPEVVLRDSDEMVEVRIRTVDGEPVDFPLRLFDIARIGRIEVFTGIPDSAGIRFAWRGGDIWASEMTGVGKAAMHISWPLGQLPAGQITVTAPNELRLAGAGRLVVETPEAFVDPLFCARHPGSSSRLGRREEGRIVFDRLPPGEYAVGSRGWVESASMRWAHTRLGPVTNSVQIDAGSTARVRWDPAWGRVDVSGAVRTTGVEPAQLLVFPVYAEPQFPFNPMMQGCVRVRRDGAFALSDLEGRPAYLVIARADAGGAIVPYTVCEPGASVQVQAGDVEVRVTGTAIGQKVVCAYEPRVPGGRLIQRVDVVTREGTSGVPIELRAVPDYVDEIRVRIGERVETVPVRVVPGQRNELVVPW